MKGGVVCPVLFGKVNIHHVGKVRLSPTPIKCCDSLTTNIIGIYVAFVAKEYKGGGRVHYGSNAKGLNQLCFARNLFQNLEIPAGIWHSLHLSH